MKFYQTFFLPLVYQPDPTRVGAEKSKNVYVSV